MLDSIHLDVVSLRAFLKDLQMLSNNSHVMPLM